LYFLSENVIHLNNKNKPCFLTRIINFLSPKVAALLFVSSQICAFVNETSSLFLCLCPGVLVAETKLQDKFASLRRVNSFNSQDTFQICFTDMYLVEFLANFVVFHMFLSISLDFADIREFCGSTTARSYSSVVQREGSILNR